MVTGRPEGTGLGLSIAQAIVHRHGGLLSCDSRPGETCFSLYLPMEE
jgi:two-component system nitrogen regulation sensor histidine kinase GlnL